MGIKTANDELKTRKLPKAFKPQGTSDIVVNCDAADSLEIPDIMAKHGYRYHCTFSGVNTDYQLVFRPGRR